MRSGRGPALADLGRLVAALALALAPGLAVVGCGGGGESGSRGPRQVIQNLGSDTMVNLAQAWAEEYVEVDSTVSVEVSGGGSGTGIAALIAGTVDIANCSREMSAEEEERARQNTGKSPEHFTVGYDALAVYVHRQNPLAELTMEQLAEIYGEHGQITRWSQLGIANTACRSDQIIRISRQSNSGTYEYFREAVLGHQRDMRLGSRDLHGSKDVVELVGSTPCAIGYSGMGYATERVKMVSIARQAGDRAYPPTLQTTLDGTYPIARPLFMYTLGAPAGVVKQYLDWVHSEPGQKIVADNGYVPLSAAER